MTMPDTNFSFSKEIVWSITEIVTCRNRKSDFTQHLDKTNKSNLVQTPIGHITFVKFHRDNCKVYSCLLGQTFAITFAYLYSIIVNIMQGCI